MKAVLINSKNNTVELIEVLDPNNNSVLEEWYKLCECTYVTTFYLYHLKSDMMFVVDDEGLLSDPKDFFILPECNPVAGNAVVYGIDFETGETIDWSVDLEWFRNEVKFRNLI